MSRPTESSLSTKDVGVDEGRAAVRGDRRFAAWTGGYAGVVAALVTASSVVSDQAAVVLYGMAVVLIMPVGMGVVPALWVNTFTAVLIGNAGSIAGASLDRLTQVGIVLTFSLLAVGNAWILRQMWQAVRRLSSGRALTIMAGARSTQPRPRATGARIAITALVGATITASWWSVGHLIPQPALGHSVLTDWLTLLVPAAPTAVLCRLVGYRWFDALAWLLPPWGIVLTVRMAWRASLLPYRNWPVRPGDDDEWTPVTGGRHAQ